MRHTVGQTDVAMDEGDDMDATGQNEPEVNEEATASETASADTPEIEAPTTQAPEKKHGIRGAWPVIAAVIVLLLLGAGIIYGLRETARISAAEAKLDEAITLLADVEDTVIAADDIIQAEITPELEATATAVLAELPQASADLQDAIDLLVQARVDLREDDQVLAQALQTAAEARADMLTEAETILEANRVAAAAIGPATESWALVAEAEKLSQDAVVQYNKHTKAGVTKSTELSKEASATLTEARSAMETATAIFPEAELQQFIDYIDARGKLLQTSMAIDAKWLSGKVAEANDMLDDYTKQEKALIAQGAKLPASPTVAIADAYEALATDPTDRYFAARDEARAADERVREIEQAATEE